MLCILLHVFTVGATTMAYAILLFVWRQFHSIAMLINPNKTQQQSLFASFERQ